MTNEQKIILLNDLARLQRSECLIKTSKGVDSLNCYDLILRAIQSYDFNEHKAVDDTHDFGVIWIEDQAVFFEIQCFENDLRTAAVDPSNPVTTARVLTIMLDEEFLEGDGVDL
jgi:hypothetical protein